MKWLLETLLLIVLCNTTIVLPTEDYYAILQ
jgi:hypothetical protein